VAPTAIQIETITPETRHRLVRWPFSRSNPLEEFIHLPHRIYSDDPQYIPMLNMEQADLLDRQRHPFYKESAIGGESYPGADATFLLARRGNRVVGRVAAFVNHIHNSFETRKLGHDAQHGFFGFFECERDYEVAAALLDSAADWLRERGMTEVYGPASPSHNYYFGSRRTSEEPRPGPARVFETHNHDYYNDFYAQWGMSVARRLFGYTIDLNDSKTRAFGERYRKHLTGLKASLGLTVRPINMRDFDAELARANDLINRTLELNWGYSPMTVGELKYMAESMRFLVDPNLVLIAEIDGQPVGISLGLPDYNEAFARMGGKLRHAYHLLTYRGLPPSRLLGPFARPFQTRQLTGARIIAMGIVPEIARGGTNIQRQLMRLGPILMFDVWESASRLGYREMTASWVLEDNKAMNAPFRSLGKAPDRVWEIFQRPL
jgi:hypothetical protein